MGVKEWSERLKEMIRTPQRDYPNDQSQNKNSHSPAHVRRYNAHSIGICYEGGLDAKASGLSAPDAGTVERSAYAALMKPASSQLM